MPPTFFISDLHLSPSRPAPVAAFHAFCAGPARRAAALYVLGDLFDAWVGDDQLGEPIAKGVASALHAVAAAGVHVAVMRGNRDLLLGERFALAAGATLLPDTIVVPLYDTPTLLLHGDTLCTDDVGYQKYRSWVHDPTTQRRFLALPYYVRRAMIAWGRRHSRRQTSSKPTMLMDVNRGAVEAAFEAHGVTRMIHGHTHKPAHHESVVDGKRCERWVLPDWYDHGGCLEVDAAGVRVRDLTA